VADLDLARRRTVVEPTTDDELDRQIAVAEEDLLRNGVGRDKWPRIVH
jgi:hypothetical protein